VQSLSEAIELTLGGGKDVEEQTRRGREFVLKKLNWGRIALEVERVYQKTIDEHRSHTQVQAAKTISDGQ